MTPGDIRTKAAQLVSARFARGESAESIAGSYGVSRRAVYCWAAGERLPSRTVAGRIVAMSGTGRTSKVAR